MPGERHPTDALVADLTRVYEQNTVRLAGIVQAALRRGLDPSRLETPEQQVGDATAAYRERQLAQARELLAELGRSTDRLAPLVVGRAYGSGVIATDRSLGDRRNLDGQFGRVHVQAVEALAAGMARSLRAATERVGQNVEAVFARADALTGALPVGGRLGGVPFIGRRIDDPYRALALDAVAGGAIGLDTRRQVSAELARKLVAEGVTDATTGFVDRAGRRWPLPTYTAMVARTTTREAVSVATVNRLGEHGVDLVTISSHDHAADECTPYDGQTFSLTGKTPGYDVLDQQPPFHPNCRHVMGAADADLDAFERELEDYASGRTPDAAETPAPGAPAAPPAGAPPVVRPAGLEPDAAPDAVAAARVAAEPVASPIDGLLATDIPRDPPFPGDEHEAVFDAGTADRLAAQRLQKLIAGDPGPEGSYLDALFADPDGDVDPADALKAAKANRRKRTKELDALMGPELAKFCRSAEGKREGYLDALLDGELTIEQVDEEAYRYYSALEGRRALREEERARGESYVTGAFSCEECGRKKSRPSDICDHCGRDPIEAVNYDDPNGYRAAAMQYDIDKGYRPDGDYGFRSDGFGSKFGPR